MILHRDEPMPVMFLCQIKRLGKLPDRHATGDQVTDFSSAHETVVRGRGVSPRGPVAANRPRRLAFAAIVDTVEANPRDGDTSIAKLGVLHIRLPYQVKVN